MYRMQLVIQVAPSPRRLVPVVIVARLPLYIRVSEGAVPEHERQRVRHLVLGFAVDDGQGDVVGRGGEGTFGPVDVHQRGHDRGLFEACTDEKQNGHDVPHLVIQKRRSDQVEHIHGVLPLT